MKTSTIALISVLAQSTVGTAAQVANQPLIQRRVSPATAATDDRKSSLRTRKLQTQTDEQPPMSMSMSIKLDADDEQFSMSSVVESPLIAEIRASDTVDIAITTTDNAVITTSEVAASAGAAPLFSKSSKTVDAKAVKEASAATAAKAEKGTSAPKAAKAEKATSGPTISVSKASKATRRMQAEEISMSMLAEESMSFPSLGSFNIAQISASSESTIEAGDVSDIVGPKRTASEKTEKVSKSGKTSKATKVVIR